MTVSSLWFSISAAYASPAHLLEPVDRARGDADARQRALLPIGPGPAAMERRPFVPDQHVARAPGVGVDAFGAGGEGDQLVDEPLSLDVRHPLDREGVRRDV